MGHGLRDKRLYRELEGKDRWVSRAGSLGQGPKCGGAAGRQQAPAKEGNGSRHGEGHGLCGGEAGAGGRRGRV